MLICPRCGSTSFTKGHLCLLCGTQITITKTQKKHIRRGLLFFSVPYFYLLSIITTMIFLFSVYYSLHNSTEIEISSLLFTILYLTPSVIYLFIYPLILYFIYAVIKINSYNKPLFAAFSFIFMVISVLLFIFISIMQIANMYFIFTGEKTKISQQLLTNNTNSFGDKLLFIAHFTTALSFFKLSFIVFDKDSKYSLVIYFAIFLFLFIIFLLTNIVYYGLLPLVAWFILLPVFPFKQFIIFKRHYRAFIDINNR